MTGLSIEEVISLFLGRAELTRLTISDGADILGEDVHFAVSRFKWFSSKGLFVAMELFGFWFSWAHKSCLCGIFLT